MEALYILGRMTLIFSIINCKYFSHLSLRFWLWLLWVLPCQCFLLSNLHIFFVLLLLFLICLERHLPLRHCVSEIATIVSYCTFMISLLSYVVDTTRLFFWDGHPVILILLIELSFCSSLISNVTFIICLAPACIWLYFVLWVWIFIFLFYKFFCFIQHFNIF